jgi:signal transduction histidine kinase
LASVVTNADAGLRWLHKTTPDLDEARAALKRIVADGHRASKVIESIRTVFKTGPRERAPLDINELIQEVLSHMQAETQLRRVFVQTDFDQRLPVVAGNPVQLQQVLLNLITNAIDAMSSVANGARILRVKSELQGADRVLISVADSGCGLDPKHQDRIFEPFFTTKGHGMGMGLMICRSIVESHGGRLWMSNSDRQGAIFQFTLSAVMADSSSTARRAR